MAAHVRENRIAVLVVKMKDYLASTAIHAIAFIAFTLIGMFMGYMGKPLEGTIVLCGSYAVIFYAMGLSLERRDD